ncbi:Pes4p SCDLUD_003481 [Saccharomycodes ludwigii]|uniref:Pes4p n=1 Tax=Saccharomycodes ludwigii TaxID=36035 RepID=UPI001E828779|nr:hypothetical protein SCDLUD_003481 [Saccharomycodes ludwigii]KAH3900496.1 hypothetical protein SCDLUD_003481 [Saccharomycodes ludwigii]
MISSLEENAGIVPNLALEHKAENTTTVKTNENFGSESGNNKTIDTKSENATSTTTTSINKDETVAAKLKKLVQKNEFILNNIPINLANSNPANTEVLTLKTHTQLENTKKIKDLSHEHPKQIPTTSTVYSAASSSTEFPFTEINNENTVINQNIQKSDEGIDVLKPKKKEQATQQQQADQSSVNDIKANTQETAFNSTAQAPKNIVALYIGDLDPRVTEKMLTETFSKYKSLTSAKLCVDSITKKSLGYGYINFSNENDAELAMDEFNYLPLCGKEVRIMPSLRNSFYRKNIGTNVFFSNLPLENQNLTSRIFYDTFKKYGSILSCKLDRRKNIGFVYYTDHESAKNLIADYNNKLFFGTNIKCGIHFDKEVRTSPEFETRKSNLDIETITKETLISENDKELEDNCNEEDGIKVPHPNAIFVKNLPLHVKKEDILDFFSEAGPVKSIYSCKVYKFSSSWAFITYKRGSDTKNAIKLLNNRMFKNKKVQVQKAEKINKKEMKENTEVDNYEPSNFKPNTYKTVIYLTNLSSTCNNDFLTFLCNQERIRIKNVAIRWYNKESCTYSGHISFNTKNDAIRFFSFMNKKLIGDSVVKVSWQPEKKTESLVEQIPDLVTSQSSVSSTCSSPLSLLSGPMSYKRIANDTTALTTPLADISETVAKYNNKTERKHSYYHNYKKFPNTSKNTGNINKNNDIVNNKDMCYHRNDDSNFRLAHTFYQLPKEANTLARKEILKILETEIKKGIDFLKYPAATQKQNLRCITEYIFEIYWRGNIEKLTAFILLLNNEPRNEIILYRQIEESINFLGFSYMT